MSLYLWNDFTRPSRLLDQHFGSALHPEDLISPMIPRELHQLMRCPSGYHRPWRSLASQQDSGSTVHFDKDKFTANLDVQQFKPEEITVKVSGNTITVIGKHEEKEDEHGYISRQFVRKYVIPKGHDLERIESKLSSDGVLSIVAPKISDAIEDHREIKIVQTGVPSKAVEGKKEGKTEEEK